MKLRALFLSVLAGSLLSGCIESSSAPTIPEAGDPSADKRSLPAEVQFFNSLSGKLTIELSDPPQQITDAVSNLAAPASATIKSIHFLVRMVDGRSDRYRSLTPEELGRIAFPQPEIRLRSYGKDAVLHRAPNGTHFTVRDLAAAIEETERRTRGESMWFGGIDVHHIYFEGIHPVTGDSWSISWGS